MKIAHALDAETRKIRDEIGYFQYDACERHIKRKIAQGRI